MADPAQRLLHLLSLLQRRVRWSGAELASELGVTERTVRRDVDRLRSLGYPIDAEVGRAGGYQLGIGGELPPLLLDDEEATAVALALGASAAAAPAGMEGPALAALTKLHRMLPPRLATRVEALRASVDRLSFDGATTEAVRPDVLATLALAIDDHQRVRADYVDSHGAATERRLEPYRLVATHRRWYLVAWDLDRRDWRTFRADRIADAELTGHRFVPSPPPDPAGMVQRAITVSTYRNEAEVWFDAPPEELRRRVPPTVGTVEDDPTGRVGSLLRTGGDDLRKMAVHLIGVNLPMEVLAPEALRAEVRALAAELTAAHP